METDERIRNSSFLALFFLGFLLMFAGVVILVIAALSGGEASVSSDVIIIVGFVPIVIGSGPHAFFALVAVAMLTIIMFVVFVWMRKRGFLG